jgi:putative transposase
MPDYRRYFVEGGTYFFTLVTAERMPLFRSAAARQLLGQQMREQRRKAPFDTVAVVLMPDHLHVIWTLPVGDANYSSRWQAIKAGFTFEWLRLGGNECDVPAGYQHERRRGVWQPRFIEHTIRHERDLHQYADYIHYNPVNHGYVSRLKDWSWSSFHRYVVLGDYSEDWGSENQPSPEFRQVDEDLLE